jgi:hypothetical protein
MHRRTIQASAAFLIALACVASPDQSIAEKVDASKIKWKRTELDNKFRSEGVAVGDFNRDGKTDIAAGDVWYAAPDWKMNLIREKAPEFDPKNYSNSFCNFTDDLNHDGWVDLIVVDFPGAPTRWFENPQNKESPWKAHVCVDVTNNESPQYLDLDGDGKRELLFATSPDPKQADSPARYIAVARPVASHPDAPWTIQKISAAAAPGTNRFSHGIGAGDISGDGKLDILVRQGWWEAPAAPSAGAEWKFHAAPLGEDCAQMYVYDFDGDKDADVLSTAAHRLGIWWHERTDDGWRTNKISDACSQTHALEFKDINEDGLPDFITGKRWWAHGPKGDVDPDSPPVLLWFELTRQDGKPVWKEHEIDHNSGVGTQFEVADVNGDKLLDVVIANKRGVFYFEQVRE